MEVVRGVRSMRDVGLGLVGTCGGFGLGKGWLGVVLVGLELGARLGGLCDLV